MRNIFVKLGVLVVISSLFFIPYCEAAPFKSYTGVIHVPSAFVIGDRVLEMGVFGDVYKNSMNVTSVELDGRITMGFERFEIGITVLTESLYTLNFKLNFLSEDKNGWLPALGWGVRDITTESRITSTGTDNPYKSDQNNSIFLVASKTVNIPDIMSFVIHLGIGANGFRADTPLLGEFGGAFAGLEIPFAKYFTFLAEMDGKHVNTGIKVAYYGMTFGLTVSSLDRLRGGQGSTSYGVAEGLRYGAGIMMRLDFSKPAPYGLWSE